MGTLLMFWMLARAVCRVSMRLKVSKLCIVLPEYTGEVQAVLIGPQEQRNVTCKAGKWAKMASCRSQIK